MALAAMSELVREGKDWTLVRRNPKHLKEAKEPHRYKGLYGGRSSAKSHFFGENAVADGLDFPGNNGGEGLRLVCVREVQKALKESAKALIEAKLKRFDCLDKRGFRVYTDRIETPGDGTIIFQGMQDHTAESVKSLEGFHRAWVEEAQTLSEKSLQMLRPTIRTPNSELWFSWNPRRKSDPVDMMFRKGNAPTDSVCIECNWSTNPWFDQVMEQERQDCLRDEPDQYDHVWEGDYVTVAKGAYFAKQMNAAKVQKRITFVPADPLMTNRVFCDIGGTGQKADAFAMWVVQFIGMQIRVLNYYEAVGQPLETHLAWLNRQGYGPESNTQVWLPHDGETHDRVYKTNFQIAFRQAGYKKPTVVPNQGAGAAMMRIEAARRVFPAVVFNETTTEAGREALGWYHPNLDPAREIDLGPVHDWSSHGADAFGLMAIVHQGPDRTKPKKIKVRTRRIRDRMVNY